MYFLGFAFYCFSICVRLFVPCIRAASLRGVGPRPLLAPPSPRLIAPVASVSHAVSAPRRQVRGPDTSRPLPPLPTPPRRSCIFSTLPLRGVRARRFPTPGPVATIVRKPGPPNERLLRSLFRLRSFQRRNANRWPYRSCSFALFVFGFVGALSRSGGRLLWVLRAPSGAPLNNVQTGSASPSVGYAYRWNRQVPLFRLPCLSGNMDSK